MNAHIPGMPRNLLATAIIAAGLTGCGGGSDSGTSTTSPTTPTTPSTPTSQSISGSPVDGPIANAIVKAFNLDLSQGTFDSANPLDEGTTDSKAAIQGLALPFPLNPPYILEFTSTADTIDLGIPATEADRQPKIGTLRTLVTKEMLDGGQQIYATPLTTMVVDLALEWYRDYLGAGNSADQTVFEGFLDKAKGTVADTLGFGLVDSDDQVDLFTTPPLITDDLATEDVEKVIKYRTAVEAAAKVIKNLTGDADNSSDQTTKTAIGHLIRDLKDGAVDGQDSTSEDADKSISYDNSVVPEDTITNSRDDFETPEQIRTRLNNEKAETAPDNNADTSQADLSDDEPVIRLIADADGDGIPDNKDTDSDNDGVDDSKDDFPFDKTRWLDSDGDGVDDAADDDDDNDNVPDSDDDYPLDASRSSFDDQDNDGWPADQDSDDTDPDEPGIDFVDTDKDGKADEGGKDPDNDDDNDGVLDDDDKFPLDRRYARDTDGDDIADRLDDDIDGDGVLNAADPDPFDAEVKSDFDKDGIADNFDKDDDNDGSPDEEDADDNNPDQDGDGIRDGRDAFPQDKNEHRDSDKDGVGDNGDNCPTVANSDQLDANQNDLGAACEAKPVADGTEVSVDEDGSLKITLTGQDSDSLNFEVREQPGKGSLSGTAPDLTYTPAANEHGPDKIGFVVSNGEHSSELAFVKITINPVNDAPTINLGFSSQTASEDTGFALDLSGKASDIDSPSLVLDVSRQDGSALPEWLNFNAAQQLLGGTPGNSDTGNLPLRVTVSDGAAQSSADFTLMVEDVNDAPVIGNTPPAGAAPGESYSYTPSVSDVDSDSFSFSFGGDLPAGLSFNANDGSISGTVSVSAEEKTYSSLTLTVNDGEGGSDSVEFSIAVSLSNHAPTIDSSADAEVDEDSPYSVTFTASDSDNDDLTFSVTGKPDWLSGAQDGNTYTLSGTPLNSDVGTSGPIIVSVSDGTTSASADSFSLTVLNTNDAPTISGTPLTAATAGSPVSFSVSVEDVDQGDSHTFSISNNPSWLSIDPDSGLVSGTPTDNDEGNHSDILISVTDKAGASASLPTFSINVTIPSSDTLTWGSGNWGEAKWQ